MSKATMQLAKILAATQLPHELGPPQQFAWLSKQKAYEICIS
jgi:hypothetical protein